MVLRGHAWGESVLGVEHHLLVCPLGELGVGLVDVGGLWGHLAGEGLAGLLLELGLVEGGVEGGGIDRGRPRALGLLLGGEGVRRLAHCLLLLGEEELLLSLVDGWGRALLARGVCRVHWLPVRREDDGHGLERVVGRR